MEKQKDINSYKKFIKNLKDLNLCLDKLKELNTEREKLIILATSKNPPDNIIEQMDICQQKYQILLDHSNTLLNDKK